MAIGRAALSGALQRNSSAMYSMQEELADRVVVIVNRASGSEQAPGEDFAAHFKSHNIDPVILAAASGEELEQHVKRATEERAKAVVVAGGDGTINTFAQALSGSDVPLGIIPSGTFNYVARNFGIPQEAEQAIAVIAGQQAIAIDAPNVNGYVFLNNASLGLYALAIQQRERQQARFGRRRWVAFAAALYAVMRPGRRLDIAVESDGQIRHFRTHILFVGNNARQLEDYNLKGADCLARGQLVFHITKPRTRRGLLWLALRLLVGATTQADELESFCASSVTISARRRRSLRVVLDGELVRLALPLNFSIQRNALKLITPQREPA